MEKVVGFADLNVYKSLYQAMLRVHKEILPKLPASERFGLIDQAGRASKSPCALIAEGYARRTSGKEWKKYLRDATGECNEMMVHLSMIRDLYGKDVGSELCKELISTYNICGKQLYRLAESWNNL
jgi:four helix bundle protein